MTQEDRMEHERVDAKNALEEFVYETRDKLDGRLADYVADEERENICSVLSTTEDWLYDEGTSL